MYDVERLRAQLEERNQRLVELEQILNAKEAQMKSLKDAITAALYGFEKEGLSVYTKDGMVYVSMDEKLLFRTGSIQVDPRGVQALKTLAGVLEVNPDIKITVEGHTDDVPIGLGLMERYPTNWELSAARAIGVVRIMQEKGWLEPERLSAAGYSYYRPVASNDTAEGRRQNRRIEITLVPQR